MFFPRILIESIEPTLSLFALRGLDDIYRLELVKEIKISPRIWQSHVELHFLAGPTCYGGVAESTNRMQARVRAAAEAYEKVCHFSPESISLTRDINLPYGYGVSLNRKTAILRAYGEYYERKRRSEINCKINGENPAEAFSVVTPLGEIWVAMICLPNGFVGSGYGLSQKQAIDSAERSAMRAAQYGYTHKFFKQPGAEPRVVRLTPKTSPWLECYFCGHLLSEFI